MDDSGQITEEQKNDIYNQLFDALLSGLQTNAFSHEESQISAEYILSSLERIDTHEALTSFLEDLSERWPIYKSVYAKFANESLQKKDAKEIDEARKQLNSL